MKAQGIRLLDVFLLGPFMAWYAVKSPRMPAAAREALFLAGLGTVLYNGWNYLEIERAASP